jgi:hypothetical protein
MISFLIKLLWHWLNDDIDLFSHLIIFAYASIKHMGKKSDWRLFYSTYAVISRRFNDFRKKIGLHYE